MENEQQVRTLIIRVLNVAETGHPDGKPQAIYIYPDGKNGRKEVTLGVGFTEDGGNLERVPTSCFKIPFTALNVFGTRWPGITGC